MYIQDEKLLENRDLRSQARAKLKGIWLNAILICFLAGVIAGAASGLGKLAPAFGFIISFLISGPLNLGVCKFFLRLNRAESPAVESLFDGFKQFVPAFTLQLVVSIFVFLWSLLLVVPGIIAALRYSQAFYILNDNPEMGAMEALDLSKKMMAGHKGKLFLLGLSFIGWALLGILTLGIGFLWLCPYVSATMAAFYDDLKGAMITQEPPALPPTA